METFMILEQLLQNLLIATGMAIVVALICRSRKIGPAGRHILWVVVLVKMVTPPLIFWPWTLPSLMPASLKNRGTLSETESHQRIEHRQLRLSENLNVNTILPEENVAGQNEIANSFTQESNRSIISSEIFVVPRDSLGKPQPKISTETVSENMDTREKSQTPTVSEDSGIADAPVWWQAVNWAHWLGGIWLAGVFWMVFLNVWRIAGMCRQVRRAEAAPNWLVEQITQLAKRIHVRRPEVALVRWAKSPMLWTWKRPCILWPIQYAERPSVNLESWQGVIVHELAHLKRRDHWVGYLELIASCLWWWNPLFWYVRFQIHENAELACDAKVVECLPHGRRAYAEALLTVCENMSRSAVSVPALGVGNHGTRRFLERRLKMIMKERVPSAVSRSMMLAVIVLGVIAIPGWSQKKNAGESAAQAKKPAVKNTDEAIASGEEAAEQLLGSEEAAKPVKKPYRNQPVSKPAGAAEVRDAFGTVNRNRRKPGVVQRTERAESFLNVTNRGSGQPNKKETVIRSKDGQVEISNGESTVRANEIILQNAEIARMFNVIKQLEQQVKALQSQNRGLQELLKKRISPARSTSDPYSVPKSSIKISRKAGPFTLADPSTKRQNQPSALTSPPNATRPLSVPANMKNWPIKMKAGSARTEATNRQVVSSNTITLQRTSYFVPESKSKALETFLRENLNVEVLSIRREQLPRRVARMVPTSSHPGGPVTHRPVYEVVAVPVLTITTTPEVQKVIAGLVTLLNRHDGPWKTRPAPLGTPQSAPQKNTFEKYSPNSSTKQPTGNRREALRSNNSFRRSATETVPGNSLSPERSRSNRT
ncbi:MAG: hypothetical protein Tsb009_27240 [Planctomycetaceae bacterium]